MPTIVGLDIGTKAVKAAVVSGSAKKFRLVDFFVEEIPEVSWDSDGPPSSEEIDLEGSSDVGGLPISVSEVVGRALAKRGLQHVDVIGSLDTQSCIIRELRIPFTRDEQIRKTLPFEAEHSLITFDVDELILEYHKVDEYEGKSIVALFAARHGAVSERLGVLAEAGVDPVALDLDCAALFNAYALTPTFDEQRTTLLVDIGATTTKVLLIDRGTLKKVRAIRLGEILRGFDQKQLAAPEAESESEAVEEEAAPDEFELPDVSSIEARFDEIETALRRLSPGGARTFAEESDLELEEDEPIAILTDDEFSRVSGTGEELIAEDEELDLLDDLGEFGEMPEPPEASGFPGAEERPGGEGSGPGPAEVGAGASESALAAGSGVETPGDVETPAGGAALAAESSGPALALADDEERERAPDYQQFLERLGVEIERTFATNFMQRPVELICLTGGMVRSEEAQRYFSQEFDVETIELDFGGAGDSFEEVDVSPETLEQVDRVGAVAVGLAVKEFGRDRLGFDFRKGPFRYERRFEKLKYPLLLTGVMLSAYFLFLVFDLISQYQFWGQRARQIREREQVYYDTYWGDLDEAKQRSHAVMLAAASRNVKEWQEQALGRRGGGDLPVILDEIEALKQIANVFRQATGKNLEFEIKSIDLKLKTKTKRGASSSRPGRSGGGPRLEVEAASRIILMTPDWDTGESLDKLFETTTMWDAAPAVVARGDQRQVTLTLTPKDSYLLTKTR